MVYPATQGDVIRDELCALEEADVIQNSLFQVREGEKVHVSRLELGKGVGAAAKKHRKKKKRFLVMRSPLFLVFSLLFLLCGGRPIISKHGEGKTTYSIFLSTSL